MFQEGALGQQLQTQAPKAISTKQRLVEELSNLTSRTDAIKEALMILEKNPEIERLLTVLGRIY